MDAATLKRMIEIREDASGMVFATCEDEPTFFVAQISRETLETLLPIALERAVLQAHHRDMTVVRREPVDADHILATLMAREALERQHTVA
jgi:hypothetical protein